MTEPIDVRVHLQSLHDALDAHLTAVESRSGEADPAVFAAYVHLADAFGAYEEVLYDTHDEVVPMTLIEFEVDDEEEDDEEEDDEVSEADELAADSDGDDDPASAVETATQ